VARRNQFVSLSACIAMQRPFNASELLPYLYLGSAQDAANLDDLKKVGITHIVNVADNVKNHHPAHFKYLNLMVKDRNDDAGISRVFAEAHDFVDRVHAENGKVLVHCLWDRTAAHP
jgi:protein-tyrosine phosphatase